jgi:hypothetical protein
VDEIGLSAGKKVKFHEIERESAARQRSDSHSSTGGVSEPRKYWEDVQDA